MQYTKHTLPTKLIPLGTIVTVFGTGSEMNNGAVITNEEKKIKGALWGAQAEFAFLDPAYSLSVPMQQVISGVLKIGKVTDFQCHMLEHQLGAYTNCNHGAGLAVIHPVLYRHIYKSGAARFARFAQNVWGIAPKGSDEETAAAGIDALAAFIKEIGLPTSFAELGIPDDTDFRAVADSTNVTAGCCKKLTRDEICEILQECL